MNLLLYYTVLTTTTSTTGWTFKVFKTKTLFAVYDKITKIFNPIILIWRCWHLKCNSLIEMSMTFLKLSTNNFGINKSKYYSLVTSQLSHLVFIYIMQYVKLWLHNILSCCTYIMYAQMINVTTITDCVYIFSKCFKKSFNNRQCDRFV